MSDPLLSIENLSVGVGPLRILDGVSFAIERGEVLSLVGESGSGKSVTALSIIRLLSDPARITAGRILFEGRDLPDCSEADMRSIRGAQIAMIFQEPMSSLNPVLTIGEQIVETIVWHQNISRRAARERAIALLEMVEIPAAARRIDDYPHHLSGGMRQRVMIAIALACRPTLLIADEPTTALDVTVQAQILDLLRNLQREMSMSVLLITHDLGVVAEFADRVVVLYAGRVVESAPVGTLFSDPSHPYTRGLIASMPSLDGPVRRPAAIAGSVPGLADMPRGCRFQPRCSLAVERCAEQPPFVPVRVADHQSACWLAEEVAQ
jgi:peptide/nickel transport system ATP-binding protein